MVSTSKLVKGIDFGSAKEYEPVEEFIKSENSDNSRDDFKPIESVPMQYILKVEENEEDTDKLYTLSIESKLTQVMKRNKSMTAMSNKSKEIYADLWGPNNSLFQS